MDKKKNYRWQTNLSKKERATKYNKLVIDQPKNEEDNFIKKTKYMMLSDSYLKLTTSAKILFDYMKLWALNSNEFWQTGKFKYARTMLENVNGHKVLSSATVKNAQTELENAGFIDRQNNNKTNEVSEWSFSDRWFTKQPRTF